MTSSKFFGLYFLAKTTYDITFPGRLATVATFLSWRSSQADENYSESVGFEPTRGLNLYTLSKRAPSATRPTLQLININIFKKISLLILFVSNSGKF